MIRKTNVRNVTKFKRSARAISPIIATLLLIAITVVAALVAYAWVSGYIGGTTANVGHEIQIPSFTSVNQDNKHLLTVYVQNTGQGVAQLKQDGAVYANDTLVPILTYTDANGVVQAPAQGQLITVNMGQTTALVVDYPYIASDYVRIKVVMVGGGSMQASGTGNSGGTAQAGSGAQYAITVTQTANGVIAPGTSLVNPGASPTFTITPSAGYYIASITANGASVPVSLPSGQSYQFVPVYATGTLTATYAALPPAGTQYTITVTQTANGVITPGTGLVNAGASPTFTITPDNGYYIASITANGASVPVSLPSGQSYQFVPVYATGTLTATYAALPPAGTQYTITVTQTANGVITPGTTMVNAGDTPTFTITPLAGYYIASITANGASVPVSLPSGQSYQFVPVYAAGTLTATYAAVPPTGTQYTITVTQTSDGVITPGTTAVNSGTTPSFLITPNTGYIIASITANGNSVAVTNPAGQIYTFSPVSAAGSITATFSVGQYSVNFVLGAGGASMNPTGTQTCQAGSQVSLSATPDSTHTFSQWTTTGSISIDTPTSASATATINGAGSITATFSLIQYQVTFTLGSGGASINPTGTQSYGPGVTVPLSATPDSTHTFSQWTTTGSISIDTPTSASATATINGAGSITATFSLIQCQVTFTLGAGGASMNPTGTQTYPIGSPVAITATPDATHAFTQWTATGSITFDSATTSSTNAHINGAGTITATFSAIHGALDHFAVTAVGGGSIGTQTAGTPYQITVTACDGYGNAVASYTGNPSLTSSSWSGNLNLGIFNAGTQTGAVTSTISGSTTITATDGSTTGTSNQFTVNPGTFDHFTLSNVASPQVAGTGFSLTISAVDTYGNTVTSYAGSANLNDLSGSMSPGACTFAGGVWTGQVTITKAVADDAITATDSGSSKNGQSIVFTVNPGALSKFAFSTISSPQVAGASFSVTITAVDSNGNTVASYGGSAALSDSTGSISPVSCQFAAGAWSGSVTITKAQANDVITATDSGSSMTGQSGQFTVNSGALAKFAFSSISSPQVAGTSFSVTITAVDTYGNTVTSYAGPAGLTDASGSVSPTSTGAFTGGVCSVSVTITKAYSNDALAATDGSTTGTSNSFTVNPGALGKFAFSSISTPQVAGTSFSVTITAQDANGNTITSYTGPAMLSDLSSSISPTTTGTFVSGVWSGSVTITKTYTADSITATDGTSVGASNTFDVSPGALDHFTISSISSPQIAGTAFSVTVTAFDNLGNVKTNYAGPAALSDLSNSISPASTGAFTNGVCSGLMVTITKVYTNDVITVTDSTTGVHIQSNQFNIVSGSLNHFVFDTVGTQIAGMAFSVTITAEDSSGNTVLNYAGSAGFTDLSGTISLKSTGVFVNGILTASVSISKAYSSDVVTATDASTGVTGNSNTFDVNAAAATKLIYTAGATQSITTNTVSSVITVQQQDSNGNPVIAGSGGVTLTLITSSATGTFYSDSGGATKITTIPIQSGQSSASYYYSDTASGQVTLTASSGTLTPATTTFTISANKLVFTTGASQSLAPGQTSTAIQISQETPTGGNDFNLLSTTTIQLTSSSPTGKFVDSSGTQIYSITVGWLSYQSGTFYYVDTAAGTPTLTGYAGGFTPATTVFTIYTPTLNHFTITASGGGNIGTQATGKAFSITITAIDQNGKTIISYTGTNTLTASTGTISPATTGAFAAGVWTGSVTLDTAGSISISTSGGGKSGQSNTFTVYTPTVDHFTFNTISSPQTAGSAFSVTITAIDQNGNTFTGYSGPNTITDSTGTFSQQTGTFASGVWTGSVTLTKAGSGISLSTSGGGKSGQSNTFTVNGGALYQFSFNTISGTKTAHTSFSITITALDQYGNVANTYSSSTTLTETGSGAGGTVSPGSVTFNNGVYTGNVYVTKAGASVTITATRNSVSSASNTFTVNSGSLDHFSFSTINSPQRNNVAFSVTITAQDQDGNTVTSYSSTQTLNANSLGSGGSRSPTSVTFASGVWTGSVTLTVTSTRSNVYLYISGYQGNNNSNTFTVSYP